MEAPSYLNALGQREVLLRERGLKNTQILAEYEDEFDFIDLSQNSLTSLTTLPLRRRLRGLLVAGNHIARISEDLGTLLPNLEVLALHQNELRSMNELRFLRGLPKLRHLTVDPIETSAEDGSPKDSTYRDFIVWLQPKLRFLNHERVTDAERQRAEKLYGATPDDKAEPVDREKLLARLDAATSLEEVEEIEALLKSTT